ncbi:hypothetical protein [Terrarubrum flagellatum]|uniref:hypothetical protein n=1 Tax=Terrirubrum flagellatum TaxID=2895980 RepID=UPI003144DE82
MKAFASALAFASLVAIAPAYAAGDNVIDNAVMDSAPPAQPVTVAAVEHPAHRTVHHARVPMHAMTRPAPEAAPVQEVNPFNQSDTIIKHILGA